VRSISPSRSERLVNLVGVPVRDPHHLGDQLYLVAGTGKKPHACLLHAVPALGHRFARRSGHPGGILDPLWQMWR